MNRTSIQDNGNAQRIASQKNLLYLVLLLVPEIDRCQENPTLFCSLTDFRISDLSHRAIA